jgi:hypothetical protein
MATYALDAGKVRAGSRFRLVVSLLGRGLPLTYQVTSYSAENRDVLLDATSGLLRARDRITVRPIQPADRSGSRSLVSYRADVTMRGPFRLFDPLLSRGFASVGDRAAAGLARVLGTPAGSAARAS